MQKPECLQKVFASNEESRVLGERTVSAIPSPLAELDSAMAPFFPSARGERSPYDDFALDVDIATKGKLVIQPRRHISGWVRKCGGGMGGVGGVLALIAFFLPWFVLQSSCGGDITITSADNTPLLPFFYMLAACSCLSLGIIVFTNKEARLGWVTKFTYFLSSSWGLTTVGLMSIFQPGTIRAVLSGFWIAVMSFFLALLGSIVTFLDD